jgi:hypothetical protein
MLGDTWGFSYVSGRINTCRSVFLGFYRSSDTVSKTKPNGYTANRKEEEEEKGERSETRPSS